MIDTDNWWFLLRFLFQAAHGYLFSSKKWREFLQSRPAIDAPVSLDEIEVDLCTLPDPDDWDVNDLEGEQLFILQLFIYSHLFSYCIYNTSCACALHMCIKICLSSMRSHFV